MKEQLYKKKGRRYYPIGYSDGFTGFPTEGIWFVKSENGAKSSQCLLKLGEVQDLHPTVDLLVNHKDQIVDFIIKRRESGVFGSPDEFAIDLLKYVANNVAVDNSF